MTPGVETTTGPLGQGLRQRGRLRDRRAAARRPLQPSRPRDRRPPHVVHRSATATSWRGSRTRPPASRATCASRKLIVCWDDNSVTFDGPASWSFSEDIPTRFEAYGWRTLAVDDGNDLEALDRVLRRGRAIRRPADPRARATVIGYGGADQGRAPPRPTARRWAPRRPPAPSSPTAGPCEPVRGARRRRQGRRPARARDRPATRVGDPPGRLRRGRAAAGGGPRARPGRPPARRLGPRPAALPHRRVARHPRRLRQGHQRTRRQAARSWSAGRRTSPAATRPTSPTAGR